MFSNCECKCVNVTKYMPQKCQIQQICGCQVFFQALNTPKLVFGRSSAPDPTGEAYEVTMLSRPP